MEFSGFIETCSSSTSAQHVFDLLVEATGPAGYEKLGLFSLKRAASEAQAALEDEPSPIIVCNYPDKFRRQYEQERRDEVDPLLRATLGNLTPLIWGDVVGRMKLSPVQQMLCGERTEAGIFDEIICPVHAPDGRAFALRLARGQPGSCDPAHLGVLQVIAIHFYYAFAKHWKQPAQRVVTTPGLQDIAQSPLNETSILAKRERECLLWTARGKSASSISVILGLSENTVNFYVKNAMKKLGTTNRMVAVVSAVRSGLIKP